MVVIMCFCRSGSSSHAFMLQFVYFERAVVVQVVVVCAVVL